MIDARAVALFATLLLTVASPVAAQTPDVDGALDAALSADEGDRLPLQQAIVVLGAEAVPRLIEVVQDEQIAGERRATAAWALGEIADVAGCEALAATPPGGAAGLEVAVEMARARCGDLDPLRARLEDDVPVLVAKAALTLALLDDTASYPRIAQLSDADAMAPYRLFITLALGLLGDEAARPTLEELLREQATRPLAAIALARLGDDSMIFELQFAYGSDDPIIRDAAVRAVVALRPPGAEDLLATASGDPLPRIADYAARELRLYPHRR